MTLTAGQTLTHYEILGPLGAGGMGEVYRARDARLDREVAIKVLPDDLADDGERLRRFEREAKTLASLSQANVAHVYGIDQVESTCFIAMELVPGEDLATRLARGRLSVDEAIDVCRQIAEGLEAAHEAGVVHRDLKPANVRVTPEGVVKILDFGLAKPIRPKTSSELGTTTAESDSFLVTEEGLVLGTPTYMSPEQARGKSVDRRTDVWAFGCVLYECLTGRRAFGGESLTDILAAIVEGEPDWSALPSATPPPLRDLLVRCLRKDVKLRMRDVGDARVLLHELAEGTWTSGAPREARPRLLPWILGAAVPAIVLLGFFAWRAGRTSAWEDATFRAVPLTSTVNWAVNPTWSPGGESIAFARSAAGGTDIWLKDVASDVERPRRTELGDEQCPRWSPDGGSLAFLTTGEPDTPIKLMSPRGIGTEGERTLVRTYIGTFDIIAQREVMGSRPWGEDEEGWHVLVSCRTGTGELAVFRVPRDGGEPRQLTFPPAGIDDRSASYSFDGRTIAFVRTTGGFVGRVMTMPAEGGEPRELALSIPRPSRAGIAWGAPAAYPSWRPDGESLVLMGWSGLWEVDVSSGSVRQLTVGSDNSGLNGISISSDDHLAYAAGRHTTVVTLLDLESGERRALTDWAGTNFGPRFSPDGSEIAYYSDRTGQSEIWVVPLEGEERRITFAATPSSSPDWSPDGNRLAYVSMRGLESRLCVADSSGGNAREVWDRHIVPFIAPRWGHGSGGQELIACAVFAGPGWELWVVPPDDPAGARRLRGQVLDFDWYLDTRRILCTVREGREERLIALHLETGEEQEIWAGAQTEIDVSPDGRWVLMGTGPGHLGLGRSKLELALPDGPEGLPTRVGEPIDVVRPDGPWHTHHGTWSPDSRAIAYVRDDDRADVFELIEE